MMRYILFCIMLLLPSVASGLNLDFAVTERAGVLRNNGHVHYSIPFSKKEGLLTTENFRILNHSAEFTVLSRYGGDSTDTTKPIRMVLVDFQDTVGANQSKTYTLITDGPSLSVTQKLATDQANYVEINTGPAVFRISKLSGNLFDYVKVNNTILVDKPVQSGMSVTVNGKVYSSYNSTPTVNIFRNGDYSASVVVRGRLEDDNHSPLVAPTPQLDKITPDSVVGYAFYYTFYKGKTFAEVEQTLKNNGRGWSRFPYTSVEHLYLDSWQSQLQLTAADNIRDVAFKGYTESQTSASFTLRQDERNDHGFNTNTYDFYSFLAKDGTNVKTWTKYNGYAAIKDSTGGVMVADKWFWQNYPSEFIIKNNMLEYRFLPTRAPTHPGFTPPIGYSAPDLPERYLNAGPQYRMPGGTWKTHRTVYYFYTTNPVHEEILAELQDPLIITLDPGYIGDTNFFCFQFDPNFTNDHTFPAGEKLQDSIDRWRSYARSIWDPDYDHTYGKAFQTHRNERKVPLWSWVKDSDGLKSYTYPSWYGWLRFGGSPRALNFGFNNQHYDFSYQAYLVSQRENLYPVYQLYEEMVEHLTDVLTLHDPDGAKTTSQPDDKLLNGSQRYEEDSLNDNYQNRSLDINDPHYGNAHVWTQGVYIYYLLTGSPRYAEALEQYLYHVNASKTVGAAKGETRDLTRLIGTAIDHWEVFGDSTALDSAWAIWERLEAAGSMVGTDMFALDSRIADNKIWIGYDAMGIPYILRLYYALDEAQMAMRASHLLTKIKQMAKWNRDMVMGAWPNKPGSYSSDMSTYYKYTTTNALFLNDQAAGNFSSTLPYHWDTSFFNANYSLSYCDLYAFMFRETADPDWLDLARTAFKDRFMYNMANLNGQSENPAKPYWQPYGISASVGSGSWKFGMATIIPLLYLQTEQWISTGWKPEISPKISSIILKN